jgi:hypothetical protein
VIIRACLFWFGAHEIAALSHTDFDRGGGWWDYFLETRHIASLAKQACRTFTDGSSSFADFKPPPKPIIPKKDEKIQLLHNLSRQLVEIYYNLTKYS